MCAKWSTLSSLFILAVLGNGNEWCHEPLFGFRSISAWPGKFFHYSVPGEWASYYRVTTLDVTSSERLSPTNPWAPHVVYIYVLSSATQTLLQLAGISTPHHVVGSKKKGTLSVWLKTVVLSIEKSTWRAIAEDTWLQGWVPKCWTNFRVSCFRNS